MKDLPEILPDTISAVSAEAEIANDDADAGERIANRLSIRSC